MADARRLSYWQDGLFGWIVGTIGIVGVLIASSEFGVLAYSISQRKQEIGVRVALGASTPDVFRRWSATSGRPPRLAGVDS